MLLIVEHLMMENLICHFWQKEFADALKLVFFFKN